MKKDITDILCVDLEDWYNANLACLPEGVQPESRIEKNTDILLDLFEKYRVKATFFAVGEIAEKFPDMIKKIALAGHEIGCHSNCHRLIYDLTPEEFREDTRQAKAILESIINKPVETYRAPSWSITEKSFWALGVLSEEGFKRDSSIFPFKNFLYGVKNAPRTPYCAKKYDNKSHLLEIPPSTLRVLGVNIPFSGGFYLRALPYWFICFAFKMVHREGSPVIMYIHPWEIDADTPRLKLNLRDSIITYYGIGRNKKKIEKLLKKFSFASMEEINIK